MRGEVWLAEFGATVGREQAGRRPALIVSADAFNAGLSGLVIALPITGTRRGLPSHVPVHAPEGGLAKNGYVLCEQVRSISKQRLINRLGVISGATMARVEDRLSMLLGL